MVKVVASSIKIVETKSRSIVKSGLNESQKQNVTDKAKDDIDELKKVLDEIGEISKC